MKNFPVLYHCARNDPGWKRFLQYALHVTVPFHSVDDVTFLTYNNRPEPCLAEVVMKRNNLPHTNVARNWPMPWTMWGKIIPVAEYLEKCDTSLVALCDGDDGFALPSPNVKRRFEALNCDVLFCGTPVYYPPDLTEECKAFELSVYRGYKKPHLSAGAYIGRVDVVRQILDEMATNRSRYDGVFDRFSDQRIWRRRHMELYPRIKVDVEELLVARYDILHQSTRLHL